MYYMIPHIIPEDVNCSTVADSRSVVGKVRHEGQRGRISKGCREMSDEYIPCLDCGNVFTGVDTGQTHQIVCFKYIQFTAHQLYFNKAVQKEREEGVHTWPLGGDQSLLVECGVCL